jgi:ankyrin repeat protein
MDPPKTPPTKAQRKKGKAVTHSELHRAVLRNNADLVRRVLLRGAGPWGHANARDWWGRTPLHRASERGFVLVLLELIERGGADVNAQETQWLRTSLHMAAERGFSQVVKVLLAHGANPNLVDRQKASPLMLAIEHGDASICEQLLDAGSRVNLRNNQDMNALHIACQEGNEKILRMLVNVRKRPNNNSDVEARCVTKEGVTTPLHLAAKIGNAGCVRALLEQAAEVNVRNHMGWSPLHVTAWYSHVQAAAVLMAHPTCKLDIISKEGETAYDLAQRRKRQGPLTKDCIERKPIPAHLGTNATAALSFFGQEQQTKQHTLNATIKAREDAIEKQARQSLAFFRTAYTDREAAIRSALHAQTMSNNVAVDEVVQSEYHHGTPEDDNVVQGELDWEHNLNDIRNQIQAAAGKLMIEQKWAKSAGLNEMIELLHRAEKTCSAAMRTTAASIAAMEASAEKTVDKGGRSTDLAALLSSVNLEDEDQTDVLAAEKNWRADEKLFQMACNLLVDNQQLTETGSIAKRSYHWQLQFQHVWERLQHSHGWSVRSASVRERVEPGARVQVRMSAAATLLDETLTVEERTKSLEIFTEQMGGSHNVPLEGIVRTRYKDGTYEITFSTGDTSRILRQDIVELEDKDKSNAQNEQKGELKLYDVVAVKLDGWDRWHDAEITKVHSSHDKNPMNNKYDVKLTLMNTPEVNIPRVKIRKGFAPGSAGSPFYYFKPGALRQSNKCTLDRDFFGAEQKLVQHLVHNSDYSGRTAALAACQLRRQITALQKDVLVAKQTVNDTEASRARNLGADMLNMAFRAELSRLGKYKPKKKSKYEQDNKNDEGPANFMLTKSEIIRMMTLNPRARMLLTEGVTLLHSQLGRSLLKPGHCLRIMNEIDKSRDQMITVNELVEFCHSLKESESRRIISAWELENIFLANGAQWKKVTGCGSRNGVENQKLCITTQCWIDIMQRGDMPPKKRMKELRRELTNATIMKGGAIEANDKEDEVLYTKIVKDLERELGRLADEVRIAIEGAKVFDILEQKELMPGMMHLKDVHRYKHHLELLNQGKRNTQVLQVNMLLDIVQRMEHEDQSHEEALEALNILFNKIDPDRNLRGHDGRVAQPTLYKSLAYDPQARSLLSLVSKRASLQRDTAESETRRQMAKRVDSLLALLIQESDGKNDARPMLSISIDNGKSPRAGYIGPDEFYNNIRSMETVRRERVIKTLTLALDRIVVFASLSSPSAATWEIWQNTGNLDATFRQIMRDGGLSVTLDTLLLSENKEVPTIVHDISTYLTTQALRLGDPTRSMSDAEKVMKTLWQMVSRGDGNGDHQQITLSSSPTRPTPRAILISKTAWMKHFVHPETRIPIVIAKNNMHTNTVDTNITSNIPRDNNNKPCDTIEFLTQEMLDCLPMGLRLARQAPHAHLEALKELSTEHDGYLLQSEMLSFGERQAQGLGLKRLMLEIKDDVQQLRTRQANAIRLIFDQVGGRQKNKQKLPKSDILKAIAYDTKVRKLLLHVDCPPGLKMATTDPRKFRRLLQRAHNNTVPVEQETSLSSSPGGSSPKRRTTSKSKARDALLTQADMLAIALEIEKEENDAPRRAMLRAAGDAVRNALDLVADNGSLMGVRKDDFLLALAHKRNVKQYLTGEKQGVVLPDALVQLLHVKKHELDDFQTERAEFVTAKELLIFTKVVRR